MKPKLYEAPPPPGQPPGGSNSEVIWNTNLKRCAFENLLNANESCELNAQHVRNQKAMANALIETLEWV